MSFKNPNYHSEQSRGTRPQFMNLKYLLGVICSIPLLPVMYWQAKRIRASVPKLPEAKEPAGVYSVQASKTLRIISIGESTIAGVGVATHEEGFTGTFAKELASQLDANVAWKVYAKSGYTARRVGEELIPQIQEEDLDLIIVGLGGNDAFTLNRPDRWSTAIQQIIEQLRTRYREVPIVFTNMPPIKEFPAFTPIMKFTIGNLVEILGDELEKIANRQERVYFYAKKITIDGWSKRLNISAERADYFSDGVHPSKLTYQAWAKDFVRFLLEQEGLKRYLNTALKNR